MMIALYILVGIATYWVWMLIHELSHITAAKTQLNVTWWKLIPYPHMTDGGFAWARVRWTYMGDITNGQRAFISLAPRIPDLIGLAVLQAAWFMSGPLMWFWTIFWFGAVVDLAYGSIGKSDGSDLRKASVALKWSPWILRVGGWILALAAGLPHVIAALL